MDLAAELDVHRTQLHAISGVIGSGIEDAGGPRITLYVQQHEDVLRAMQAAQEILGSHVPLQVRLSEIPQATV